MYDASVGKLTELYPDVFPSSEFTYERFLTAYYASCTRAFGKRLEWSALVPFADCLNHANVQTKYDYNVGGNGLFRLFPSGTNCYAKGEEVFNSYGRRKNESLLIDYGFAMLDNEWEQLSVNVFVDSKEEMYIRRISLIHSQGISVGRGLTLWRNKFPLQVKLTN